METVSEVEFIFKHATLSVKKVQSQPDEVTIKSSNPTHILIQSGAASFLNYASPF